MINTIGPRQLPCGTVYIENFKAVLVDERTLSATREKGPNPFLCVANNPEVSLRDFSQGLMINGIKSSTQVKKNKKVHLLLARVH